ncbi:MAG: hypothetical protein NTY41_00780 [Proteobacteria bacterium]|nr:hypothetical protein [Pseudomonadota bacterium]
MSDTNYGSGNAGRIDVTATENLSITNGGRISSLTFASGNAGSVKISAGSMAIDGQGRNYPTGIASDAIAGSTGNAGSIDVTAREDLSIINGGTISSATDSFGNAGSVKVAAGTLLVDGRSSSIIASARSGSSGQTGSVTVLASESITLGNGGRLSIQNDATADHPNTLTSTLLTVSAPVIALKDAQITAASTGNVAAGNIKIGTDSIALSNGGSITSDTTGQGKAGDVDVSASSNLSLADAGQISSSTAGPGSAGTAAAGSSGQTGSVSVIATDSIILSNEGSLSIQNDATADNSSKITPTLISVTAPNITLKGGQITAASSGNVAASNALVNASGNLSLTNGGVISSGTSGTGNAGSVEIAAGTLLVDGTSTGINAKAAVGSSGQTGIVSVIATDSITLSNAGELSIRNDATVANPGSLTPTLLTVSAPVVTLKDASITAASTGNVAASSIQVIASERLSLDPSSITTSANLGNGGSITIQGGKFMTLDNSRITTSVAGLTGNGGDIDIRANALIMNTGFIQANTAARDAAGGKVGIDVRMLVPSGSSLFVGGQTPYNFLPGVFGFNVIQAAAPTGVSGTIQIASPVLDISGSLNGLNAQVISTGGLGRSPCQISSGSSLAQSGRGGLPPSARGLLRPEPGFLPLKDTPSAFFGKGDQYLALNHWGCS